MLAIVCGILVDNFFSDYGLLLIYVHELFLPLQDWTNVIYYYSALVLRNCSLTSPASSNALLFGSVINVAIIGSSQVPSWQWKVRTEGFLNLDQDQR
jgi:hypothetical protein